MHGRVVHVGEREERYGVVPLFCEGTKFTHRGCRCVSVLAEQGEGQRSQPADASEAVRTGSQERL